MFAPLTSNSSCASALRRRFDAVIHNAGVGYREGRPARSCGTRSSSVPTRVTQGPQRRVLGSGVGLAHGGSGPQIPGRPRRAGPVGVTVAAALCRGPGGRQVRRRDRYGRDSRPQGPPLFAKDEHNRPETTLDGLAALKPAFRPDGTITAGNAPGLNSGAAAVVLADEDWARGRGLAPAARLVSYGIAAVEPGMFGLGPIPAVRRALDRAGWRLGDIERVEINEAFAAIAVVVTRELGLPEDIVNVEGGSIAHGHPIGATGAVLTTCLIHSMRRDGLRRGIVTLCIGGGQGIALAFEIVS
jgi:hypothetical protein